MRWEEVKKEGWKAGRPSCHIVGAGRLTTPKIPAGETVGHPYRWPSFPSPGVLFRGKSGTRSTQGQPAGAVYTRAPCV